MDDEQRERAGHATPIDKPGDGPSGGHDPQDDKSWVDIEQEWLTRTTDEPPDTLTGPDPAIESQG